MLRYRVAWQRAGWDHYKTKQVRGPNDAQALVRFLRGDIDRPDAYECCSGYGCNCGGFTRRQFWQNRNEDLPPLQSVWIETRETTPWRQHGEYIVSPVTVAATVAALTQTGGRE